jgi:hypothetical protein
MAEAKAFSMLSQMASISSSYTNGKKLSADNDGSEYLQKSELWKNR